MQLVQVRAGAWFRLSSARTRSAAARADARQDLRTPLENIVQLQHSHRAAELAREICLSCRPHVFQLLPLASSRAKLHERTAFIDLSTDTVVAEVQSGSNQSLNNVSRLETANARDNV